MTDHELLELAAKAYGVEIDFRKSSQTYWYYDEEIGREQWHPLDDDRQAFRLAVKLNLLYGKVFAQNVAERHKDDIDIFAATRRAIVCATAEIMLANGTK